MGSNSFAGHHKLDNLTVVVDYNKLQGFGYTKDILSLEPFFSQVEGIRLVTIRSERRT